VAQLVSQSLCVPERERATSIPRPLRSRHRAIDDAQFITRYPRPRRPPATSRAPPRASTSRPPPSRRLNLGLLHDAVAVAIARARPVATTFETTRRTFEETVFELKRAARAARAFVVVAANIFRVVE
jgi:hypothetical protein